MPYRPLRPGLSVANLGGGEVDPIFLANLHWYCPLREDGVNSTVYVDYGPSRFRVTLNSSVTFRSDAAGPAAALLGDPVQADRIRLENTTLVPVTGSFTAMGWARPSFNGGGAAPPFDVVVKAAAGDINLRLFVTNLGAATCSFTVAGVTKSAATANGFVTTMEVWRHYAATYDGALIRLYVDGVQVASSAAVGTPDPGAGRNWNVGRSEALGASNGCMYRDCAVWNGRALSAYEIGLAYQRESLMLDNAYQLGPGSQVIFAEPPPAPPTPRPAIANANDFLNMRHDQFCNVPGVRLDLGPKVLFTTNTVDFRAGSHKTFIAYIVLLGQDGADYSGGVIRFGSSAFASLDPIPQPYSDWMGATPLPAAIPSTGFCFYVPQTAVTYADGIPFYVAPGVGSVGPLPPFQVQAFGWWT